jgi:hypothetical protein
MADTNFDDKVRALVDRVLPVLIDGADAGGQLYVLAELVAMWLAVHPSEDLRQEFLTLHIETVRDLLPKRVAEFRENAALRQALEVPMLRVGRAH